MNTSTSTRTGTSTATGMSSEASAPRPALNVVVGTAEVTPQVVASLLDVLIDHDVDHALTDLEQTIARLRVGAEQAGEARRVLRGVPAQVLREAMWLRAARVVETTR